MYAFSHCTHRSNILRHRSIKTQTPYSIQELVKENAVLMDAEVHLNNYAEFCVHPDAQRHKQEKLNCV